jgi:acyl-CoA thioester hydrolase
MTAVREVGEAREVGDEDTVSRGDVRDIAEDAEAHGAGIDLLTRRFRVPIVVRSYEMDVNGHLNQAVYHQYTEHARMEHIRRAGLDQPTLDRHGITVVLLASTMRYLAELRAGDVLEVDSTLHFTDRKPFTAANRITRVRAADGTPGEVLAAEAECTVGVLDVAERRLVAAPYERLVAAADRCR